MSVYVCYPCSWRRRRQWRAWIWRWKCRAGQRRNPLQRGWSSPWVPSMAAAFLTLDSAGSRRARPQRWYPDAQPVRCFLLINKFIIIILVPIFYYVYAWLINYCALTKFSKLRDFKVEVSFEVEIVARRLDDPNAVVVLEKSLLRHVHHCNCSTRIIHDAPAVHVGPHEWSFAHFCDKLNLMYNQTSNLAFLKIYYHWKWNCSLL